MGIKSIADKMLKRVIKDDDEDVLDEMDDGLDLGVGDDEDKSSLEDLEKSLDDSIEETPEEAPQKEPAPAPTEEGQDAPDTPVAEAHESPVAAAPHANLSEETHLNELEAIKADLDNIKSKLDLFETHLQKIEADDAYVQQAANRYAEYLSIINEKLTHLDAQYSAIEKSLKQRALDSE